MAKLPVKSEVDMRAATDEQIFKRLNKKLNGLNRSIEETPNIQNQGDLVKPDGTIAKTDEDIRLIEGIPRRTPTGMLEYHEHKVDENFPVKIKLETVKYETNSFMDAVDHSFEHFLKGFDNTDLPIPNITVAEGPKLEQPGVGDEELNDLIKDAYDIKDKDSLTPDEEDEQTATEEYDKDVLLLTEVNSAGDLTGVGGRIWMVWKGLRYRFYKGSSTNSIDNDPIMTTSGHDPVPRNQKILGLTNTKDGRNLEVFLVDRDLTYNSIDIVPHAELQEYDRIDQALDKIEDEIEWGKPKADGLTYNTNDVVYNGITYEPGDLIQPIDARDNGNEYFLPDMRHRWTEYHPFDTNKPERRSLTYKPSGTEKLTKQWEGKLIRGYSRQEAQGYYMVCRGAMRKVGTSTARDYALLEDLPFGVTDVKNNWKEMHGTTYTIMDWDQLKELGYPSDTRAYKDKIDDEDAVVRIAQHHNNGGWKLDVPVGKWVAEGRDEWGGYKQLPGFKDQDVSYMDIPKGMKMTIYDLPWNDDDDDFDKKTYHGPKVWNMGNSKKNDDISRIIVAKHWGGELGINAGGGWMSKNDYREYLEEHKDGYYKKTHLRQYNELFE